MVDRVKPLKIEGTSSGGTQNDEFPTSLNKNEDFVDCRGVAIQNDSSDNEAVLISRDSSDNLTFQDGVVSGLKTLTDLLSGGALPPATQVGQLLYSVDGAAFSVQLPLTEYGGGWLINDDGEHLVVG